MCKKKSELKEKCSLREACFYIAFDEKPYDSVVKHPTRYELRSRPQKDTEDIDNVGKTFVIEWKTPKDNVAYDNAREWLLDNLCKGDLNAKGIGLHDEKPLDKQRSDNEISLNFKEKTSRFLKIPQKFWKGVVIGDEWINSECQYYGSQHDILFKNNNINYRAYTRVRINTEELEALMKCSNKNNVSKSAETKELKSLRKILIGLAIKHYNYDHNEVRSRTPSSIENDLYRLGITVSADTVRKHLKISLDENPDMRKNKTNSS